MDLHRIKDGRPDWYGLKREDMNRWQKVASTTHGIVTPGNAITVAGVVLVHVGLKDFKAGHRLRGVLTVGGGFFADFCDGAAAQFTHTKSPVGEIADASADKYKIGMTMKALVEEGVMPLGTAGLLLSQNLANAAATAVAKIRDRETHSSLAGKANIVGQKVSLGLYAMSAVAEERDWPGTSETLEKWAGNVATVSTLGPGAAATAGYYKNAIAD